MPHPLWFLFGSHLTFLYILVSCRVQDAFNSAMRSRQAGGPAGLKRKADAGASPQGGPAAAGVRGLHVRVACVALVPAGCLLWRHGALLLLNCLRMGGHARAQLSSAPRCPSLARLQKRQRGAAPAQPPGPLDLVHPLQGKWRAAAPHAVAALVRRVLAACACNCMPGGGPALCCAARNGQWLGPCARRPSVACPLPRAGAAITTAEIAAELRKAGGGLPLQQIK